MKPTIAFGSSLLLFAVISLLFALHTPAGPAKPISPPPDHIFASAKTTTSPDYCDTIHSEYPGMVEVGGVYYAYYSGYGCNWQIYYATSSDGIHFDKQGPINLNDGWAGQRAFPFVFYEDGLFKLYYGGGLPYEIGYATSPDGVNFTAQPQPVLTSQSGNTWDNEELVRPSIVEVVSPSDRLLKTLKLATPTSRLYMMYYNGFGTDDSAIGLAYSNDGISWQPYASNPIVTSTTGIYTSFAITQSGTTYLYYHTGNSIYLETSPDGVNFTPYSTAPILSPSTTNGWDAGLVYGAFVRPADSGGYTMYYNGIPSAGGFYGMVGIATSPDLIHFTPRPDNPAITVGNTPANFAATANPDYSISVSWHDVVTDAEAYTLYYGTASKNYSATLDVTGVESTTFTPPSRGNYFMTIIANTAGQDGYPAEERSANTGPPLTPTPTATATPSPTITPAPTATDCPNPFVDIGKDTFYPAIHNLNCRGVVSGTDATHYTPSGTASRGEFAKIAVLGFGLPLVTPSSQTFTDVPPSYFAYPYIESGYAQGMLSGFDAAGCAAHNATYPCYLPNLAITRGQLTKLVVNAAQYPLYTPSSGPSFSDVPPSNVFYTAIETAYFHGIIAGYPDGTFHPNTNIRRDEMAQIVYAAIITASSR